jgi:hypothetical protein
MLVGIYDPVQPLVAPDDTFKTLSEPARADHPAEPGLEPDRRQAAADADRSGRPGLRLVDLRPRRAERAKNKIQVLFTIYGTPRWAQRQEEGVNRARRSMKSLRYFALAAAKRYSGIVQARRRHQAAGRPQVARLERAEQPALPAAAVAEGRQAATSRSRRATTSASARPCTSASTPRT